MVRAMRSLLVAVVLVASTSVAIAQPSLTPPVQPMYQQPVYEQPLPAPALPDVKSEGTATMLALGTTAAGLALIGAGASSNHSEGVATLGLLALMVGPSAGHIYAGEASHAVGMSLVRAGAFITFVVGAVKATSVYASDCFDCSGGGSSWQKDHDAGVRMMWVGGIAFVASAVYDFIDAPRAARRRNDKGRGFMVAPMMVGTPTGPVPAAGFSGRF